MQKGGQGARGYEKGVRMGHSLGQHGGEEAESGGRGPGPNPERRGGWRRTDGGATRPGQPQQLEEGGLPLLGGQRLFSPSL